MKIAIIGTRTKLSGTEQTDIKYRINMIPRDAIILSGDCPTGVDDLVRLYCKGLRLFVQCCAPWGHYGKAAGPMRNAVIADFADEVIAYPRKGTSTGTRGCVRLFEELGKKVEVNEL